MMGYNKKSKTSFITGDGWGTISQAAQYAGVSSRTLSQWLKKNLPHARLNHKSILIKYSDIDIWLNQFKHRAHKVEEAIEDLLKDF
jgi:excisionase family DNA binding protein